MIECSCRKARISGIALSFVIRVLLRCWYKSHCSSRWRLDSIIPQMWHRILSCVISLRMYSVSLLPSHPMRILKMYLISFIMWLFNLKYICAFILYSLPPNSQKSFKVGNSLFMIVLCFAFHNIFLLIYFFTIPFHFVMSLSQCSYT